jgi:hypothetical protein
MRGKTSLGIPMALRIWGSHDRVSRFMSRVRLALVTSVTCAPPQGPAGEPPDDPAFDGAEQGLAGCGRGTRLRHVLQHPADLGAGEIGGDGQPRCGPGSGPAPGPWPVLCRCRRYACTARRWRCRRSAAVRSQRTVVSRWLVMPMAAIASADARLCQSAPNHLFGVVPDLHGIVLHPPGLGKDLLVLHLVQADDLSLAVEENEAVAGSAEIEGSDIAGHPVLLWVGGSRFRPRRDRPGFHHKKNPASIQAKRTAPFQRPSVTARFDKTIRFLRKIPIERVATKAMVTR